MAECMFCGGACGRVCKGLGFTRAKGSRGGVESRHTAPVKSQQRKPSGRAVGGEAVRAKPAPIAGVAPSPRDRNAKRASFKVSKPPSGSLLGEPSAAAGEAGLSPRPTPICPHCGLAYDAPIKRGRPKAGTFTLAQAEPWKAAGLSRAQWYRNRGPK